MDWERYKQICDTPGVFPRWMLEQTMELVEPSLAAGLAGALSRIPIEKPADHLGDQRTDMFEVKLSRTDARSIADAVDMAVNAGQTSAGTRGRGLGGFREAWQEYAAQLEATRPAPAQGDR